ncbi:O-acetyl-ADP-ribose deacetylase [Corynebacterium freiburgense]|uniref:O-acetyl-ADP-ribose deacetylase n=1 Tax=Corynebacterium freiburgense TaxID=556548 RepID=UPI000405A632|nr:O-acetyl-ADP-ribose deacetylase [Corynebacterium freiburgense]WJZ02603.1 O-acetyl-ADP-ribose deacetylase [Corynebacterium freiburgense]
MRIDVVLGDITSLQVDAIVNAANSSLLGGGGVDGAIHRKAGPELLAACKKVRARQGGCEVGQAVATPAGLLPAKYVIHTVGPVWRGGGYHEESLLKQCYINSLCIGEELGVSSIAFPNISTGVYRFPKALAAPAAIRAVQAFPAVKIQYVVFVCFDQENFSLYKEALK